MRRLIALFFILLAILSLVAYRLIHPYAVRFQPLYNALPKLLGEEKPITYLILLQNDQEMRANGGFAGSYALITLNQKIPEVRFQDIYVPTGQIEGHITPPEPIQQAFKHGTWLLPNFDWDPNFETSANTLRWFLTQAGEQNPDIIITLNLSTIKEILGVIGEIKIPDYQASINADNLYPLLQGEAEVNFFPGSTQKKDALTTVGKNLINQIDSLNYKQKFTIGKIIFNDLENQNLLVNAKEDVLQKLFSDLNWVGDKQVAQTDSSTLNDTYLLIETNLGANKSNCCVSRITNHTITRSESLINHKIEISFKNDSPLENPDPPRFYGGNYLSYLRFYFPQNAFNLNVEPSSNQPKNPDELPPLSQTTPPTPSTIKNLQEIGFFHLTKAGQNSTVKLEYSLPLNNQKQYQLSILKQNGFRSSPQQINLPDQTLTTNLERSFRVSSSLSKNP